MLFRSLSVETGIEVAPIPAITEQTANFQGLAGWTTSPARPTASFLITPHSVDFDADFVAGTYKVFRIAIQGPEGKAMCITFPRCEISTNPVHAPNGEVMATRVTIAAHEDTTAIGTTDLARSMMVIGLA